MSESKKDFYLLKGSTQLKVLRKNDAVVEFLERMGVRESQDKDFEKLTFKHQAVNKRNQ